MEGWLADEEGGDVAVGGGDDQVAVDAAYQAEKHYAGKGDPHADAFATGATEGGDDTLFFADEHGFDHEEVVVEGDDGVDQSDEHEDVDGR